MLYLIISIAGIVILIIMIVLFFIFKDSIKTKILESEAEKGTSEIKFATSMMFFQGIGVKKNEDKGLKYLKIAADEGHAQAQYLYAGTLINKYGTNDPNTYKEIGDNLLKSAENGFLEAILAVSTLYGKGTIFPQDKTRAIYWLTIAAQKGHLESQMQIANLLNDTHGADKVEAYAWYEVASANGDNTAKSLALSLYNKFSDEDKVKATERANNYLTDYVHSNINIQ